jgi:hypothetical protein
VFARMEHCCGAAGVEGSETVRSYVGVNHLVLVGR